MSEIALYLSDQAALRTLQMEETALLKRIVTIFEGNDIHYFLGYGTLLGAVRHRGFIPWDDDIDVFVPRPDYERLKAIAKEILPEQFVVNRNPSSSCPYDKSFLRIECAMKESVARPIMIYKDENRSVWVDIFPLDGAPNSFFAEIWLFFRLRLLDILLRFARSARNGVQKKSNRPVVEKVGIQINRWTQIGKYISIENVLELFEHIRQENKYCDSKKVYAWTGDYAWRRMLTNKDWYGEGKKTLFEGAEMMIPVDYDHVLRNFYGDYMTMPPEQMRNCKHVYGFEKKRGGG